MKELLSGHTSAATAYVVEDYPYGFRLRCKIRYWLEHNIKRGTRFWSQTTNPKKPGEFWNKPKASTYADIAGCMYLNEKGHVAWAGLNIYSGAAEASAWIEEHLLGLDQSALTKANEWLVQKRTFEAARAAGYPANVSALIVHLVTRKGHSLAEAYAKADLAVQRVKDAAAGEAQTKAVLVSTLMPPSDEVVSAEAVAAKQDDINSDANVIAAAKCL